MSTGCVVLAGTFSSDLCFVRFSSFPLQLKSLLVLGQSEILEAAFVILASALAQAEVEEVLEDWVCWGDGELVVNAPIVAAHQLLEDRWMLQKDIYLAATFLQPKIRCKLHKTWRFFYTNRLTTCHFLLSALATFASSSLARPNDQNLILQTFSYGLFTLWEVTLSRKFDLKLSQHFSEYFLWDKNYKIVTH